MNPIGHVPVSRQILRGDEFGQWQRWKFDWVRHINYQTEISDVVMTYLLCFGESSRVDQLGGLSDQLWPGGIQDYWGVWSQGSALNASRLQHDVMPKCFRESSV
jgi:hypothetical protein